MSLHSALLSILSVALGAILDLLRLLVKALTASISIRVPGLGFFQAQGFVGVVAVVVIIYLLTKSSPPL